MGAQEDRRGHRVVDDEGDPRPMGDVDDDHVRAECLYRLLDGGAHVHGTSAQVVDANGEWVGAVCLEPPNRQPERGGHLYLQGRQ